MIICELFICSVHHRTVMKSGPEIVKAGLRQFFESAADDIEKMVENLKLGKVSSRNQVNTFLSYFLSFHHSFSLLS